MSAPPRTPSLTGWEGLRKPPRLALSRNIAKSEKGDFCAISGRKSGNIGLLCHKVRMFCLESTDVCVKEIRCFCAWTRAFYDFFPLFLKFLRQNAVFSTDSSICWNRWNANTGWQKGENLAKISSGRDAMPCQNFWRFSGFWTDVRMVFSGDFGRSVQYVLAFLDRCICHAGKSSECPTNGAKIQLSRNKMHGSLLQNAWKMSRNIVQTTKKEYFCTIIAPRFLSSLGV